MIFFCNFFTKVVEEEGLVVEDLAISTLSISVIQMRYLGNDLDF